jgi:hypothetical protein
MNILKTCKLSPSVEALPRFAGRAQARPAKKKSPLDGTSMAQKLAFYLKML